MSSGSGGTYIFGFDAAERKKNGFHSRGDCFSRFRPLPRRLHALVAARRLKAVASAHAACSATAAGAVAAGSAAAESVIPLPSAASPPAAHHCQLSIVAQRQRIAAALHSCFATMQPALCRLRRPSLTACSRFDSSASWVSQILSVPESQQCQWPRYRRCYASNCQLPESLLRAHCF